jgi:hypothetical protein
MKFLKQNWSSTRLVEGRWELTWRGARVLSRWDATPATLLGESIISSRDLTWSFIFETVAKEVQTASVARKCRTKSSDQKCHKKVVQQSSDHKCHKKVSQEFWPGVSQESVATRVQTRSVARKCRFRPEVLRESVATKIQTRSVARKCRNKSSDQKCRKKVSRESAAREI